MRLPSFLSTLFCSASSPSRNFRSRFSSSAGYSLIELLIAIGIVTLLVGGGIAAFITFNDRQTLNGAGKQMVTYLRSAQSKARVGDTPSGCAQLNGYSLSVSAGTNVVTLYAVCSGGNVLRNTFLLPEVVTNVANAQIEFRGLRGGAVGSTTFDLTSSTTGKTYRIQVTPGGEIREEGVIN